MKNLHFTIFTLAAAISLANGTPTGPPTLKITFDLSPKNHTWGNDFQNRIPEPTTVDPGVKNVPGTATGQYTLDYKMTKENGKISYKAYTLVDGKYAYAIPWEEFETDLSSCGNLGARIESARGCYINNLQVTVLNRNPLKMQNPVINLFTFEKTTEDADDLKFGYLDGIAATGFTYIIAPQDESFVSTDRTRYVFITVENNDNVC